MDEYGPHPLLTEEDLSAQIRVLVEAAGLSDWRPIARRLEQLALGHLHDVAPGWQGSSAEPPTGPWPAPTGVRLWADILPHLLAGLARAANPERVLLNFERLVGSVPDPADLLAGLAAAPRGIDLLIALFAGSQFLTEILLRSPEYFDRLRPAIWAGAARGSRLTEHNGLAQRKTQLQFDSEASAAVAPWMRETSVAADFDAALDALRRYQRWELLRIGVCDLLGLLDLPTVTAQLSCLAESTVNASLEIAARQTGADRRGFVVLAMGKLGGGELNYSSDIDLLFLARGDAEAHRRLAERLIAALTRATAEGFLYQVDMRLRPWGRVGPLVSTLDGYLNYLERHARLWERQALLRGRPIAGDRDVGADFLAQVQRLLFTAGQKVVRADVHAMKQRTEAQLRETGQTWGEVKLGEGSIRDIEFVVQYLQLAHGGQRPELRSGHTLEALTRLAERGLLTADDHRVLTEGYVFLRTVEHYLQILDYRQTHRLPTEAGDLCYLAQRLGFTGADAGQRFVTRYGQHSAAVRAVYLRHLNPRGNRAADSTQRGEERMTDDALDRDSARDEMEARRAELQLRQHLARMAPHYAEAFSEQEIRRHAELAGRLSDNNPVEVRAEAVGDELWRVTVVAYDYLGELSLICGLLFAFGFSILSGQVFTYEPGGASAEPPASGRPAASGLPAARGRSGGAEGDLDHATAQDARRKIVDVFTVRAVAAPLAAAPAAVGKEVWLAYASNLGALLRLLQTRLQREAQGELAKRVALALHVSADGAATLHPVDIEIDNATSERYTILRIEALDTPGFLYEFTNALALNGIHIAHVAVETVGNRVHDTLYVTDAQGRKIIDPRQQRELRAATVLVKHFTHLLPRSPNPESALLHFHEYLGELFRRPSWPDELASLQRPEVLAALARLLGVSEFLWDDFLRMQYANLFPVVQDPNALASAKTKGQLTAELTAALSGAPDPTARRETLNAFKDREMFRIDMRHILPAAAATGSGPSPADDFGQFSAELTDLVEVVVTAAVELAGRELRDQHGEPITEDGRPIPLSLCVLGKCGGYELGFASDIEVMLLYGGAGRTSGPKVISAAEYFDKLVTEFGRAIWSRRAGIFEIDLDLRPYGKAGSLAVSLDSFRRYFAAGGPAWAYERQALIKLRAIAGDAAFGRQVEALRDAYVYSGAGFDAPAMRAMRERQLRHLATAGAFNAKFSLGGLVDVEYLVQGLQMMHGHAHPGVRLTNTQAAIAALADHGMIAAEDAAQLSEALLFLRRLINALRMVRGNSKDLTVPPETSEEFAFLARRLGYGEVDRISGGDRPHLLADLTRHTAWVRRLSGRLLP